MNQPVYTTERLFNERLEQLKLVAKEYKCAAVDERKVIHILKDGKPIHEFTRAEIIYSRIDMNDLFIRDLFLKLLPEVKES